MGRHAVKRARLVVACALLTACGPPPDFAGIRRQHPPSSAWLLDRHGAVMQELRVDFNRRQGEWLPLAAIARPLREAVVAAEDRRFYDHGGVDGRALAKALWQSVRGGSRRGASTLSMQLAGFLEPGLASGARKGLHGKVRQMWAAWRLERALGKDQILEAYLNLAPFRGETRGVSAAAARLFGKGAGALTHDEALLLAALLPAPQAPPEQVAARACRYAAAPAASPDCARLRRRAAESFAAPSEVPAADHAPHLAARLPLAPGARLRTTLDLALQRRVEGMLEAQLSRLADADVEDGAVLVLDNASGDVLAYVGSRRQSSRRHVDGVRALRQAGSTLKPFLYAQALGARWLTAASTLEDSPVAIAAPGGQYVPQNYDHSFKGPVSVRSALAGSLNVPAVRTLLLAGIEPLHETLLRLGLPLGEDASFYGYALALGSPEVDLFSLTNAYRALANGGRHASARLLPAARQGPVQVLDPAASFIVADILADRAARSLSFGLENPLATPFWSAVKTGTSKDMRDNWCIGFTRRHTVGVWVGNFDGRPMRGVSGVTGAAPLWLEIMQALHVPPDAAPAPPAGVVRVGAEWFVAGTEPRAARPLPALGKRARIVYPGSGMVLAVDPDVPAALQRVVLRADAGAGHGFVMNGESLGAADRPLAWRPRPGHHLLQLQDATGGVVEEVRFLVR
jgi:penicillin-binding protein 1C